MAFRKDVNTTTRIVTALHKLPNLERSSFVQDLPQIVTGEDTGYL